MVPSMLLLKTKSIHPKFLVVFSPICLFHCAMGAVLVPLGRIFKLLISLDIKVSEQDDECKHVADLKTCPSYWESTRPENRTRGVGHCEEELDKLQLRDILLPPQI